MYLSEDYWLKETVSRMRDSFESQELETVKWNRGPLNLADTLRRHNFEISPCLNVMLTDVMWIIDLEQGYEMNSAEEN